MRKLGHIRSDAILKSKVSGILKTKVAAIFKTKVAAIFKTKVVSILLNLDCCHFESQYFQFLKVFS